MSRSSSQGMNPCCLTAPHKVPLLNQYVRLLSLHTLSMYLRISSIRNCALRKSDPSGLYFERSSLCVLLSIISIIVLYFRHAPLIYFIYIWTRYSFFMGKLPNVSQSVWEVLCKISTLKIGDPTTFHLLHWRCNVLECLY